MKVMMEIKFLSSDKVTWRSNPDGECVREQRGTMIDARVPSMFPLLQTRDKTSCAANTPPPSIMQQPPKAEAGTCTLL